MPHPLIDRVTTLARNRALTAADTWERHLIVAALAGAPRQVLDVGGLPGQLASFMPGTAVVAANITQPADLLVPADGLPFTDRAIEVVTSLDALEHVPPAARPAFVGELVRVTARRLILCCPLGTPEHVAAEREVNDWYRNLTGEEHIWLLEHEANTLPTEAALRALFEAATAEGDTFRLAFHGDFRVVDAQFKEIVTARHRPRPGAVLRFASNRLAYRPDTRLTETPTAYTNRVFVIVDRAAA